jgi:hypothetical protein
MGRYLDILRARRGYEINEIHEDNGANVPNNSCNSLISYLSELEGRCPDFVPVARWQLAVEDGRRFLAQWGAQAEALGWTPDDLFGLHPAAPLARYDHMGLVWTLRGSKVVALTEDTATIRMPSGSLLQFYRKLRWS